MAEIGVTDAADAAAIAAGARRADYVRALREERDGYARVGKTDRIAAVDEELARVTGAPQGRSETPTVAAPSRTRKRG
jgi:hypothetical protein